MADSEKDFTLIYDGECQLCLRSVAWLRARDRGDQIEFLPLQAESVAREFPEIPRSEMEEAMQLLGPSGRRWSGAAAVERVIGLLPSTRGLQPIFALPGARPLAAWIYRWVARNRSHFGCGEHCEVSHRATSSASEE
jgi:predicted DCC family thiol-disulfide oxidoreductase YuxK